MYDAVVEIGGGGRPGVDQRSRAGIEWRCSLVDGGDGEIGGNVVRLVELRMAVKWFLGSRINW